MQATAKKSITGKSGKEHFITNQLTDALLKKLVDYAHIDEEVIQNTSDATRFHSLTAAQAWLKKAKKEFFILSNDTDHEKLTGIIWFEELTMPTQLSQQFPLASWTFGIRIYQNYRGDGLALPFMEKSFKDFLAKKPNQQIWLSTKVSNSRASSLYEKFGFKEIGIVNEKRYYIFPTN